jgi:hypothetical protein
VKPGGIPLHADISQKIVLFLYNALNFCFIFQFVRLEELKKRTKLRVEGTKHLAGRERTVEAGRCVARHSSWEEPETATSKQ